MILKEGRQPGQAGPKLGGTSRTWRSSLHYWSAVSAHVNCAKVGPWERVLQGRGTQSRLAEAGSILLDLPLCLQHVRGWQGIQSNLIPFEKASYLYVGDLSAIDRRNLRLHKVGLSHIWIGNFDKYNIGHLFVLKWCTLGNHYALMNVVGMD